MTPRAAFWLRSLGLPQPLENDNMTLVEFIAESGLAPMSVEDYDALPADPLAPRVYVVDQRPGRVEITPLPHLGALLIKQGFAEVIVSTGQPLLNLVGTLTTAAKEAPHHERFA